VKALLIALCLLTPSLPAQAQNKPAPSLLKTLRSFRSFRESTLAQMPELPGIVSQILTQQLQASRRAEGAGTIKQEADITLTHLIDAYNNKDGMEFMSHVCENFDGNRSLLESAIASDFRTYLSVNLRAVPAAVTGTAERSSLAFRYFLTLTQSDGKPRPYSGDTQYDFCTENSHVCLCKMRQPILFGSSMPPEQNPTPQPSGGTPGQSGSAPGPANNPPMSISGPVPMTCGTPFSFAAGLSFGCQRLTSGCSGGVGIRLYPSCAIRELGSGMIQSAGSFLPPNSSQPPQAFIGHLYALSCPNSDTAVIRIESLNLTAPGSISFTYAFPYSSP
jgi:hypothetical protein